VIEVARLHVCEDLLASGAVITGGATQLPGMVELGEEILGLPVRLGVPKGVGGLAEVVKTPSYATGVGLVQYGAMAQQGHALKALPVQARPGLWGRMRKAISTAF
jgi:cell division protein FtsA